VARIRERLIELTTAVGDAKLTELKTLRDSAMSKRAAATIAASATFDSEPLAGVGTGTWRVLWLAARDYSIAEAYHEHNYPEVGEGARCVLCQQILDDQAKDRFSRFDQYMTDTTEHDAVAAERAYAVALSDVSDLVVADQQITTRRATLQTHDPGLSGAVGAFLATLETRRGEIVAHLTGNGPVPRAPCRRQAARGAPHVVGVAGVKGADAGCAEVPMAAGGLVAPPEDQSAPPGRP